jgi:UDP-N-acetyl-L-fucosamine synthase
MKKLKVITILGTRPEIIRLSEVIKRCDIFFEHILVHTGQNWDYTLNEIFFKDLNLKKPDYYLESPGKNLGETIGNIISKTYDILKKEDPDAILVLGDTNSALSTISAKRLKIPIFHMEAGNRCFDQNVPEEINRKIVDHISDINLSYTEHSRRYLIDEGLRKDHIFVVGSPMKEVLDKNKERIENSKIINELGLNKDKYIIISAHREENIDIDKNFNSLMNAINKIAEFYKMPVIYSTHPRSMKKIKESGFKLNPLIKILKPFGFLDYISLQENAFVVVSDSGTLSEEASILGFPGVLIRTSTERPEVIEKGGIVIGGITEDEIISSINVVRKFYDDDIKFNCPDDYQKPDTSMRIVKIIQSYTKIINKLIWNKDS